MTDVMTNEFNKTLVINIPDNKVVFYSNKWSIVMLDDHDILKVYYKDKYDKLF